MGQYKPVTDYFNIVIDYYNPVIGYPNSVIDLGTTKNWKDQIYNRFIISSGLILISLIIQIKLP